MTGAISAANVATVEPRSHGRKQSGKDQPQFDAAMKIVRPGERVAAQARAATAERASAAASLKVENSSQDMPTEMAPSLAEVLRGAFATAPSKPDVDDTEVLQDSHAEHADADDSRENGTGWTAQARFDAAIWKALGPEISHSQVHAVAGDASVEASADNRLSGDVDAPAVTSVISGTIDLTSAADDVIELAKVGTDVVHSGPKLPTAPAIAATIPDSDVAKPSASPAADVVSTDSSESARTPPADATDAPPSSSIAAVDKTDVRAPVANGDLNAPTPVASATANQTPVAEVPKTPAPDKAQPIAAPTVSSPSLTATVAVATTSGSEQRGLKIAAHEPDSARTADPRGERMTSSETVDAADVDIRPQSPSAERSAPRNVPPDARDTGRSPIEQPTPDPAKPMIAGVATVAQQPPQPQAATPAGAVISTLGADPAWSAYFQETQPGQPGRVSSLKIQLNPSELGMVTAHLLAGDEGLTVELIAESVDAQNKLAADTDLIARSLRAIGIDIDRVTVQLATRNDDVAPGDAGQPRNFSSETGAGGARGDGGGERNGQAGGQSQAMRGGQQAGSPTPSANSGRYI